MKIPALAFLAIVRFFGLPPSFPRAGLGETDNPRLMRGRMLEAGFENPRRIRARFSNQSRVGLEYARDWRFLEHNP